MDFNNFDDDDDEENGGRSLDDVDWKRRPKKPKPIRFSDGDDDDIDNNDVKKKITAFSSNTASATLVRRGSGGAQSYLNSSLDDYIKTAFVPSSNEASRPSLAESRRTRWSGEGRDNNINKSIKRVSFDSIDSSEGYKFKLPQDQDKGSLSDLKVTIPIPNKENAPATKAAAAQTVGGKKISLIVAPKNWSRPKATTTTGNNDANAFKSLDDVIQERKIERPPSLYADKEKDKLLHKNHKPLSSYISSSATEDGSSVHGVARKVPLEVQRRREQIERELHDLYADLDRPVDVILDLEVVLNPLTDILHTPMQAAKLLSECGMVIKVTTGRLMNPSGAQNDHLFRSEVSSGRTRGVCDSARKVVAKEMAAQEFLLQLKKKFAGARIPRYLFPDKILIDFKIVFDLEKVATEKKLEISHKTLTGLGAYFGKVVPWYFCTYSIGTEMFYGEAANEEDARKNAAINAFYYLTGRDYPGTKCFVGDQCDPTLNHDFVRETEMLELPPETDFPTYFKKMEETLKLDELQIEEDILMNEVSVSADDGAGPPKSAIIPEYRMVQRQIAQEKRKAEALILRDPNALRGVQAIFDQLNEENVYTVNREMKLSMKVGLAETMEGIIAEEEKVEADGEDKDDDEANSTEW